MSDSRCRAARDRLLLLAWAALTCACCRLQALYGGLYGEHNVVLSGIHTHSGPGGYLEYVLYDITSLGFVRQSFDALVDGILAVSVYHPSTQPCLKRDRFRRTAKS